MLDLSFADRTSIPTFFIKRRKDGAECHQSIFIPITAIRDWFANEYMRESDPVYRSACNALLTSTLRLLKAVIGKAKKPSVREPADLPNWPPLF